MDVREKLVEIVCDAMERDGCIGHCNNSPCFEVERVVNALIANGVTVQECGNWKYYHKQNKAVCTSCSFERDLDANFGKAIACPNCGAYMSQPPKGE